MGLPIVDVAPLVLAAEGGYQDFVVERGELLVLALSGASAVLALVVGLVLVRGAGVAIVVLVVAVAYSKRSTLAIGDDVPATAAV
ncbi:MAG: hypothetical protein JJE52_05065 [Acidimicrobiia bacterium]|nr:hypothetical protein [Acidimicrobiia bacterium]